MRSSHISGAAQATSAYALYWHLRVSHKREASTVQRLEIICPPFCSGGVRRSPGNAAGCGTLLWNITQGEAGVNGARYVLNMGFKNATGLLLNETVEAVDATSTCVSIELYLHLSATNRLIR